MSYIRSDGMSFKDPDEDAVIQSIIGDIKRLQVGSQRGSEGSAFLRRDQGLQDLLNPVVAARVITQAQAAAGTGPGAPGQNITITRYTNGAGGIHSFQPGCTLAIVHVIGGGGGGGGISGNAISLPSNTLFQGGGGGGGSGGSFVAWISAPDQGLEITQVGGGGGGAPFNTAANGADGTDSIITWAGITYVAGGGQGGFMYDAVTSNSNMQGGLGGRPPIPAASGLYIFPIPGQTGGTGAVGAFALGHDGINYTLAGTDVYAGPVGGTGGTGFLDSVLGAIGDGGMGANPVTYAGAQGSSGAVIVYEYIAAS